MHSVNHCLVETDEICRQRLRYSEYSESCFGISIFDLGYSFRFERFDNNDQIVIFIIHLLFFGFNLLEQAPWGECPQ